MIHRTVSSRTMRSMPRQVVSSSLALTLPVADIHVRHSIALVCFEHLLTLKYEVDFLRTRKVSAATWIFLSNRYLLLGFVLSILTFLSFKYQAEMAWDSAKVIGSLVSGGVSFVAFILVELYVAPAPVLAPWLLKLRIPVLIGCVATCTDSVPAADVGYVARAISWSLSATSRSCTTILCE